MFFRSVLVARLIFMLVRRPLIQGNICYLVLHPNCHFFEPATTKRVAELGLASDVKVKLSCYDAIKDLNIAPKLLAFHMPESTLSNYLKAKIVYELCRPVVESPWTPTEQRAKLNKHHVLKLFDKQILLRAKGIIHRDIRPENVVVSDDDAFFIDFGCAIGEGKVTGHAGSIVTASQRVLQLLSKGENRFEPTKDDHLEPFLKMVLWYKDSRFAPTRLGTSPEESLSLFNF